MILFNKLVNLVVWDKEDDILQKTKGGWPHVTVAYTGKSLPAGELACHAGSMLSTTQGQDLFNGPKDKVTLTEAYVNSFECNGKMRHDCLVRIDKNAQQMVTEFRDYLRERFPEKSKEFSMHDPHVTCGIHDTVEAAQEQVDRLNALLPRGMTFTGVCID
jgi:hypothetical protein